MSLRPSLASECDHPPPRTPPSGDGGRTVHCPPFLAVLGDRRGQTRTDVRARPGSARQGAAVKDPETAATLSRTASFRFPECATPEKRAIVTSDVTHRRLTMHTVSSSRGNRSDLRHCRPTHNTANAASFAAFAQSRVTHHESPRRDIAESLGFSSSPPIGGIRRSFPTIRPCFWLRSRCSRPQTRGFGPDDPNRLRTLGLSTFLPSSAKAAAGQSTPRDCGARGRARPILPYLCRRKSAAFPLAAVLDGSRWPGVERHSHDVARSRAIGV
jgi:hypothetical protein